MLIGDFRTLPQGMAGHPMESRGQGTMGMLPGMNTTCRKGGDGGGPSKGFGCSLVLKCLRPAISAFVGAECGRLTVNAVEKVVKTWGGILMEKEVTCSFPTTSIKIPTLLCASLNPPTEARGKGKGWLLTIRAEILCSKHLSVQLHL